MILIKLFIFSSHPFVLHSLVLTSARMTLFNKYLIKIIQDYIELLPKYFDELLDKTCTLRKPHYENWYYYSKYAVCSETYENSFYNNSYYKYNRLYYKYKIYNRHGWTIRGF